MKLLLAVAGLIVLMVAVVAVVRGVQQKKPAVAVANGQTFEDKLAALEKCGLRLAAPFSAADLLKSWKREDYEKEGFDLVLVGLGMTEEQKPWRNHGINLWHFDPECIENNGDYKKIAARISEMSQGSLALENLEDHVDIEKKQAWLSFTFKGKRIKVACKVEEDWVDPAIFGRFVELLRQSDSSKIYIYYNLGGQDCILGCVSKSDFECLKNLGLKFVPLT